MKLSEILVWEKKEFLQGLDWFQLARESIARGEGDKSLKFINEAEYQFGILYNEYTALTSCDREIDREALAKVIADYFESEHRKHIKAVQEGDWGANGAWSTEVSDVITDLSQAIISTMPTWLKRIEKV